VDSDTLDDGVLPASSRGFAERTSRSTALDTDETTKSFGVVGTKPQAGIIFVGQDGKPMMVPYSWLEKAYEGEGGRLIIEFANNVKVTLEGRRLCRPFRRSLLDLIRMQRVAYVEAMPRGEFEPDGEPVVAAIRVEKAKRRDEIERAH
jgi:hypothetical protein